MGLDQYAFVCETEDFSKEGKQEIAYWRKHNRLQGWMEALYRAKSGNDEFNCTPLKITLADLKELEKAIKGKALPATGGFFFGNDSYGYLSENGKYQDYDTDVKFLNDARKALKEGKFVFYYCWW